MAITPTFALPNYTMDAAPCHYSSEESQCWINGADTGCMDGVRAAAAVFQELLKAKPGLLSSINDGSDEGALLCANIKAVISTLSE